MADPIFDLDLRRALSQAQVAERRRAQAAAKRIASTIEYENTLRDLLARRRAAEHAAATARRRRQHAAAALVEAIRLQIDRFVEVEGPALLRAADAVARAIESAVPERPAGTVDVAAKEPPDAEPPPQKTSPPTGAQAKPNGRSVRSQYG